MSPLGAKLPTVLGRSSALRVRYWRGAAGQRPRGRRPCVWLAGEKQPMRDAPALRRWLLGPFGKAPPLSSQSPLPSASGLGLPRFSLVTSGPSWCEQGPRFGVGPAVHALPDCRQGRGVCVLVCMLCAVWAPSESQSRLPASGVRLSEEGPEAGERMWKVAALSPGLRCKRVVLSVPGGRETSHAPSRRPVWPPFWPSALCLPHLCQVGKVAQARLCSGPRWWLAASSLAWRPEDRTKGRAAHRFPLPGSL